MSGVGHGFRETHAHGGLRRIDIHPTNGMSFNYSLGYVSLAIIAPTIN